MRPHKNIRWSNPVPSHPAAEMKVIVVFAAVVAVVLAQQSDRDAQIVRSDANTYLDNYSYSYETSNGIAAAESGQLQNAGSENEAIAASGQYSYVGPDGVRYLVEYVADENGFQPRGAHLPKP